MSVRVWQIGPDGTEYYAATSELEMWEYYVDLVGYTQAREDFDDESTYELEPEEIDSVFTFNDDGELIATSWRQLAEDSVLPAQIGTGYM